MLWNMERISILSDGVVVEKFNQSFCGFFMKKCIKIFLTRISDWLKMTACGLAKISERIHEIATMTLGLLRPP